MRNFVMTSVALCALAACDESKTPAPAEPTTIVVAAPAEIPTAVGPVQGVAESLAPGAVMIPKPISQNEGLIAGFDAGGSAILKTDACPTGYDDVSKLGSIMCGKDYTVFYEASTMRWGAIGPDRSLNGAMTAAMNPGPAPTENVVVVWGLSLIVKPDTFEVAHGDGTVIGHLVHSATP